MRAMILAAGLGTRLLPYTKSLPKPLLPVNGKPLIAYPLGLVREAGVKDVVVNVYHLADQIESALKACSSMGLNVSFARERNLLETGGGLSNAQRFLGNGTFFLLNSDVVCDIDLKPVLEASHSQRSHRNDGAGGTEGQSQHALSSGIPEQTREGRRESLAFEQNAAVRLFLRDSCHGTCRLRLSPEEEGIHNRRLLPAGFAGGAATYTGLHSGYWADTGTVQDYAFE